jgi:hypothetical protein
MLFKEIIAVYGENHEDHYRLLRQVVHTVLLGFNICCFQDVNLLSFCIFSKPRNWILCYMKLEFFLLFYMCAEITCHPERRTEIETSSSPHLSWHQQAIFIELSSFSWNQHKLVEQIKMKSHTHNEEYLYLKGWEVDDKILLKCIIDN